VPFEKPIAISLAEADLIVETSERLGVIVGVGSLLANHRLRKAGAWVSAGNLGCVLEAAITDGTGEISGDGCQKLASLSVMTGLDLEWAEGAELPRKRTGHEQRDLPEEVDGPMSGRLGLSEGVVCAIPDPSDAESGKSGIWIRGEFGSVTTGGDMQVLRVTGEDEEDVTDRVLGGPNPKLRFSFIPLIDKLVRAHLSGEEVRPSAGDFRFALEAAIGMKRSAAVGGKRVELPIFDRNFSLHPHPYRALGGDVAGYNSMMPNYGDMTFADHMEQAYIVEPRHEEILRVSRRDST
jgi:hypothetical protein